AGARRWGIAPSPTAARISCRNRASSIAQLLGDISPERRERAVDPHAGGRGRHAKRPADIVIRKVEIEPKDERQASAAAETREAFAELVHLVGVGRRLGFMYGRGTKPTPREPAIAASHLAFIRDNGPEHKPRVC